MTGAPMENTRQITRENAFPPLPHPPHNDARHRKQYYDAVFRKRDAQDAKIESIVRDAPVVVELKTNCLVNDPARVAADLTNYLSLRYHKPGSCIFLHLEHSACLFFAGSQEPAYIITINALSGSLQPTLNRRNSALLQGYMTDTLGVLPERGIIRFQIMSEENFGVNGDTIFGGIERLKISNSASDPHLASGAPARDSKGAFDFRIKKAQSRKDLKAPPPLPNEADLPAPLAKLTSSTRTAAVPQTEPPPKRGAHPDNKFLALFEKPRADDDDFVSEAALIGQHKSLPAQRLGTRKSILHLFRKQ